MTAPIATLPSTLPAASPSGKADTSSDNDFSFQDLLSIVNPLQHIPVVSTLYRSLTGDTIKPLERIVGDTLYGGTIGFASGIANVIFEKVTGKDFGATALALLDGEDDTKTLPNNETGTQAANVSVALADGPPTPLQPQTRVATLPAANVADGSPGTANGPPRSLQPASDSGSLALLAAMSAKGVDAGLSQRAFAAYQKSLSVVPVDFAPVY
ncbi:MAG TPA: hypothetical protein VKB71_03795 [Rhizomicrobium sp.]|nr:hypothetical protein [Rhizomicrobium sp.]